MPSNKVYDGKRLITSVTDLTADRQITIVTSSGEVVRTKVVSPPKEREIEGEMQKGFFVTIPINDKGDTQMIFLCCDSCGIA